jgi:hypothetical protein
MNKKFLLLSILFCQQGLAAACLQRDSNPNTSFPVESFSKPFYGKIVIRTESNKLCQSNQTCYVNKGDTIYFNLDGSISWLKTNKDLIVFDNWSVVSNPKTQIDFLKLTYTSGKEDFTAYLLYHGAYECTTDKASQCRKYKFETFPDGSTWKTPDHPEAKWRLGTVNCPFPSQPGGGGGEEDPIAPP